MMSKNHIIIFCQCRYILNHLASPTGVFLNNIKFKITNLPELQIYHVGTHNFAYIMYQSCVLCIVHNSVPVHIDTRFGSYPKCSYKHGRSFIKDVTCYKACQPAYHIFMYKGNYLPVHKYFFQENNYSFFIFCISKNLFNIIFDKVIDYVITGKYRKFTVICH